MRNYDEVPSRRKVGLRRLLMALVLLAAHPDGVALLPRDNAACQLVIRVRHWPRRLSGFRSIEGKQIVRDWVTFRTCHQHEVAPYHVQLAFDKKLAKSQRLP